MIYPFSYVRISDNTGVRKLQCLQFIGNSRSRALIGRRIVAVAKRVEPGKAIRTAAILKCLVVRCKKNIKRCDGSYTQFQDSSVVIIGKGFLPKANRVLGPVLREMKFSKYKRVYALAPEVV